MEITNETRRRLFVEYARIGGAFSSAARIEILYILLKEEKAVKQIAEETELSFANASQHLGQLKTARLLAHRKVGQKSFYRIANDDVRKFWEQFRDISRARLLEVQEIEAGGGDA